MDTIKKLDMKQLKELKQNLERKLLIVNERIEGMTLSECSICVNMELAYEDIPEGWGWASNVPGYLVCKNCLDNITKKFGGPMKITRGEI